MGSKTGISWTDITWNCIRGCSRVSEGCRNCYAEHQAARIVRMSKGRPTAYDELVRVTAAGEPRWTGKVALDAKALALPLSWRAPRRVFVNSMSDLFHESLTNEQIAAVFGVMAACPQHTFQVLTKRARRMREWFEWVEREAATCNDGVGMRPASRCFVVAQKHDTFFDLYGRPTVMRSARAVEAALAASWPLPNVWLGVSVENQAAADERIPELLQTPAAVRFLSCEPLLGPVDVQFGLVDHLHRMGRAPRMEIDWVIAGCESGPGARPCSVEWLRSLRDQCADAGVAFFLKQAKEVDFPKGQGIDAYDLLAVDARVDSKRKGGGVIELPYLDGVQHAAFPEVRHG